MNSKDSMPTFIYRSEKKPDHFLYLNTKLDDKSPGAPEELLVLLGELSLALTLDINPTTKLIAADANKVLESLKTNGYYLQVPPNGFIHPLDRQDFSVDKNLPN